MKHFAKSFRTFFLLLVLCLGVSGILHGTFAREVQAAARTGFQTVNGKTYYIQSNGKRAKGFLTIGDETYYFNSSTGVQQKGWMQIGNYKYYFEISSNPAACTMAVGWRKDSAGNRRYFNSKGILFTGWHNINNERYYFNKTTGVMYTGWLNYGGYKYYFNTSTGIMYRDRIAKDTSRNYIRYFDSDGHMVRGWYTFSGGQMRYFKTQETGDGAAAMGFFTVDGNTYYFSSETGYKQTGWVTNNSTGARYYLDPANNGILVAGTTKTIDGTKYSFDVNGVATIAPTVPTGTTDGRKTIKNYLLGALQPVGQALYVWGGGWNDSTRKGISPNWVSWYNSQDSSYDYNNYRDLSTTNRAKGLDCSGFVGWAAYQVMHTTSGVGYGYTVVSGEIGSYYASLGWGSIVTQSTLASDNWKVYPGDVGYNAGHTWIILGQCSDGSAVIVHSTPQAGCQISGTPTPSGNYSSEAIVLARKYMSKYAGYTKYGYHTSSGNYIRNGNFLRWNTATLADPEGYRNMNAAEILYDLFGY